MKELIKITTNEEGQQLVSARELHGFLEVKTRFNDWIVRMCEYGFQENIDYSILSSGNPNGGLPIKDYAITIDMAKEISMIQRSEKGKQARQYFINCEKKLKEINQPKLPTTYKEALLQLVAAEEEKERLQLANKQQEQIIGELKPKADYTDVILKSKSLVTTTQIAKDYGMSGRDFNKKLHELKVQYKQNEQWLLYSKYHDKGYTHSETIAITRSNGIKDTKMNTKWTQKGRLFLYDLLKENGILPMIEMEDM